MAGLATLAVAGLASAFMAWSIGAGSSGSTPFAAAVGANAISILRAGLLVGVLGFAGAVMQGATVTNAVGRELVLGAPLGATAAILGLLTAATLVAIGVFAGYPIATAFTVTGAVVGVGLAAGGDPAWGKYAQIAALWIATPIVGGGVAYATARGLRAKTVPETWAVPALGSLVGALLANIRFVLLAPGDAQASLAEAMVIRVGGGVATHLAVTVAIAALLGGFVAWDMRRDAAAGQRHFLLGLGGLVAFSAGGSQVGLALGPLVPVLGSVAVPITVLLVGGGLGLLAGSWTGAPRMIKALSQDYSSLGPRRSIAALIPAFAIAQTAVFFGIPVSFNEIVVSAIVGAGYAAGGSAVSGKKLAYTILAWIGSLVAAFVVAGGSYVLVVRVI